jgi:hypothetical protein
VCAQGRRPSPPPMELVLGAVLATIVELVLLAFLLAPRWMSQRLKRMWRRLLYGVDRAEQRT